VVLIVPKRALLFTSLLLSSALIGASGTAAAGAPLLNLPLNLPQVSISLPQVTIPVPDPSTPTLATPSLSTPAVAVGPLSVPSVTVPSVSVPAVSAAPTPVTVPSVSVPVGSTPPVSTSSGSHTPSVTTSSGGHAPTVVNPPVTTHTGGSHHTPTIHLNGAASHGTTTGGTPVSPASATTGAATAGAITKKAAHKALLLSKPKPKPSGVGHAISTFLTKTLPRPVLYALIALALLALMLAGRYYYFTYKTRRREAAFRFHIETLQDALIPAVPATLGTLAVSAAYVPASGPGAGGDFYDAFELPDGRIVCFIGDVAGHGPEALARTAFIHYGLRTWMREGAEPRVALELASRNLGIDLEGVFCTVLVCRYDPKTSILTWASAGHPAPIFAPDDIPAVTEAMAPPIGMGMRTGQRQSAAYIPAGEAICLFTDGLLEARIPEGLVNRDGLTRLVRHLPAEGFTAQGLLESVNKAADTSRDDMAALIMTTQAVPEIEASSPPQDFLVEEIAITTPDDWPLAEELLTACGISPGDIASCISELSSHQGTDSLLRVYPRLKEFSIISSEAISFPISPFGAVFAPPTATVPS